MRAAVYALVRAGGELSLYAFFNEVWPDDRWLEKAAARHQIKSCARHTNRHFKEIRVPRSISVDFKQGKVRLVPRDRRMR